MTVTVKQTVGNFIVFNFKSVIKVLTFIIADELHSCTTCLLP